MTNAPFREALAREVAQTSLVSSRDLGWFTYIVTQSPKQITRQLVCCPPFGRSSLQLLLMTDRRV